MTTHRSVLSIWAGALLMVSIGLAVSAAQAPVSPSAPALTCAEIEAFLSTAKVGRRREIPVGITIPMRATLSNGELQHDAAIQTTDVRKPTFQGVRGTEVDFRDAWQFNVAGYELAKLLRLNMVPPYVEREIAGIPASVSWWVNDAMMERDRFKKKIKPPDPEKWNHQMYAARVFHELIGDTDNNMTNLLITKDWRLWMVDFSRAFRRMKSLQSPKGLTKIDRTLLANLRALTMEDLQRTVGRWVTKPELEGVQARRDLIVRHFDTAIASRGEAAMLYDFDRTTEPCGTGLH